jgi:putative CocE/NonD family hydrolase
MRSSIRLLCSIVSAAFLTLAVAPVRAQQAAGYERRELTIPVRDGASLFAVALIPKNSTRPLPILVIRTPFSAANAFRDSTVPRPYRELVEDGYIFVSEDIRGRFGSGGDFVTLRSQRDPKDPNGVDESTDTWDTIDWLVKNVPGNNGKVGVLGSSYPGWLAALAGVGAHPALKAISPQAPVGDAWMGDDFFHQGAFRQTQGVAWATLVGPDPKGFTFLEIPDYDHYDFYLRFPTLDSLSKATGVAKLPVWQQFVDHPSWDGYWQARALPKVMSRAEVPTLWVGGTWDAEDILGPQLTYAALEKSPSHPERSEEPALSETKGSNHLVLGPWSHNQWLRPGGDSLGPIQFGSATADWYRANVLRPWFAWYLHGTGTGSFPEAWVFEAGQNQWHTFDAWPPKNVRPRNLYLRTNGKLSFDPPPAGAGQYTSYISDPANPVPYIPRPDDDSGWETWLVQDQRFVDHRPDVATWVSEPLSQDLTIVGDVVAHLFASTTGTDADWVVKLIDVYPDSVADRPTMGGYQLIVNAGIMRGRYWQGFSSPMPIPTNSVTPFNVDLHQQLYRFKKGHRLMVQVQSTWFPLYDRNPQTFVPNIFKAKPSDFRARTHRVWHTPRYPSHLSVSVLP